MVITIIVWALIPLGVVAVVALLRPTARPGNRTTEPSDQAYADAVARSKRH